MNVVELCARAIATSDGVPADAPVGDYLRNARAVLTALAENITPEMVEAGRTAWLESASDYTRLDVSIEAAFRAMCAAAVKGEG
jgi:hypothetical protein